MRGIPVVLDQSKFDGAVACKFAKSGEDLPGMAGIGLAVVADYDGMDWHGGLYLQKVVNMAMGKFRKLWAECRSVQTGVVPVLLRHALFRMRGKNLLVSNGVTIFGLRNITIDGLLKVGLTYVGFVSRHDRTLLRIKGKLRVKGNFFIGKGCRVDIGQGAVVDLDSGFINPHTNLIIMHGLTMGAGCSVAWGCQFLDEDFHRLSYPGKTERGGNEITIGSRVWIGSNVTVLKGSVIPDGCVVAAGSMVNSRFLEKDALIAGNPAKVIRRNVSWS
jgi:acetyltransferase-like isoleucine patch superfamily enzyme